MPNGSYPRDMPEAAPGRRNVGPGRLAAPSVALKPSPAWGSTGGTGPDAERGEGTARPRGERNVTQRGTYIVIEGIDGTGKTELSARLVPPLLSRGHSISSVREPTDKFLRSEFSRLVKVDSLAASLCLSVDRAMLRPGIERALDMGDIVLQDRSFYSTLAYQYPALGSESWRELERIEHSIAMDPDLVLYLDAPVEVAIRRVESRGQRNPFEDAPYLEKVKWKFEQMFQPPRWVRIDASGSLEHTLEQAMNALMSIGL